MKSHSRDPKKRLDEREKAFEAKYQLDEAIVFKAGVRRAKLLGLWVAEKLGLQGDEAAAYARSAVEADFADAGHAVLLAKLRDDLVARGHLAEADGLIVEMDRLAEIARQQVTAEANSVKPAG
ncbi:DUF1476 domain-containing protein [Telmatospirillum sp.]|uniref:DUF1476 domain-containing protein n=1 Tax=Telmatospirillum sp. TaxID=2079197 RepID=UPI00283F0CA8|nr:DUF1476 domain-containing protein [Telmatospirillum sp.]MDR3437979.1 DUF1476 domain-containing protein [Telmatospirillum sp.]